MGSMLQSVHQCVGLLTKFTAYVQMAASLGAYRQSMEFNSLLLSQNYSSYWSRVYFVVFMCTKRRARGATLSSEGFSILKSDVNNQNNFSKIYFARATCLSIIHFTVVNLGKNHLIMLLLFKTYSHFLPSSVTVSSLCIK